MNTTRLQALEWTAGRLERRLTTLRQTSERVARVRLILFAAGIAGSAAGFYFSGSGLGWLISAAFVIGFGWAVHVHRQITTSIARHAIRYEIQKAQIARMKLNWPQIPPPLPAQPLAEHPFAVDLDLAGENSLHQVLDTATTQEGSQRLLDWLLNPVPDAERIRERQALFQELMPAVVFRNGLILHARNGLDLDNSRWEAASLLRWIEQRAPANALQRHVYVLSILAGVNIALFLLNQYGLVPAYWPISFLVYAAIFLTKDRQTSDVFHEALGLQTVLSRASTVFAHLEAFPYQHKPHLRRLCQPFLDPVHCPSRQLRRLAWLVSLASLQQNPGLALVLNAIVPWNILLAHLLNRYKATIAELLPKWLDVWFEVEALSSLANFGYLHPEYVLPKIIPDPQPEPGGNGAIQPGPIFHARQVGHPLIPDPHKVCNDFTVHRLGEVAILTGSNMSGKSSFLRTIGVNLCLAYAGGPVNAQELDTCLFRLFSCMKISDSITNGISYFYAEVRRLKALLTALDQPSPLPLFFLIDEIFRGTNNRERLVGSRAYVRALVGKHGAGLISTHDLELVRLAEEMPGIRNFHFREEVQDGRMVFDYQLRAGPSPTTNALKIMQMEGLPVEVVAE